MKRWLALIALVALCGSGCASVHRMGFFNPTPQTTELNHYVSPMGFEYWWVSGPDADKWKVEQ